MTAPVTKERLGNLAALNREIARTNERITKLKALQNLSGRQKSALKRAEKALGNYISKADKEADELLCYIEKIEDAHLREIFMLRYYDGIRSWQRIAFLAGEHDESYVRRKHNAYIKNTSALRRSV